MSKMVMGKPKVLRNSSLMILIGLRSSIFSILVEMSSRAVSSARTCRKAPIGIYVVSVPRSMNFELTYIK